MKSIIQILFCALPLWAIAQEQVLDTTKTNILNEIIIEAYRLENPSFGKVSNPYNEKIVQPKNIGGLFSDINGFSVIKRGNYAMDPTFRGAQYEQLNIQYDGNVKAVHACPNRMDPITSHIAPEEIEKIEVIKGPYSVRYGASFGGVVNLVTRNPNKGRHGWSGSVSSGYETNGDAFVGMTQLQYVEQKYDIAGNFGYRNYGNYKDGDKFKVPSSFRSSDYGIKLGYNPTHNQRLQASWRQSFGRDIMHAGLPMDTDYDNTYIASLDYKWEIDKEKVKELQVNTYYSYVDHLMTNHKRPNVKMMAMDSYVESFTAGAKAELEWHPIDQLHLYSGLDFLHIGRDGTRKSKMFMQNGQPLAKPMETETSIWQDSYIDDYGVYTEAKWYFAPSYVMTAGVRYDRVVSDIKKPEEEFAQLYNLKKRTENNLSYTLSVKKALNQRLFLEAACGRGVRSANMIERYIYKFNVGQDAASYTGNPNLKAEVNNQFEVGISGYENLLDSPIHAIYFEASVYYSDLQNYISAKIDLDLGDNAKRYHNIKDAYKTGVDASIKLDFVNNFYAKIDMAYIYAKNKDWNESLPLIPPLTTGFTLGYDNHKFWANANLNLVAKQSKISASFGELETKGYETIDLRVGFRPIEDLSIGFAGLNIFNKTYHDHLNFAFRNQESLNMIPINEPGRNFSVFIQYQF